MDKNDYTDPICPFDFSQWSKEKPVMRIPCDRVQAKEDEYLSHKDNEGALRHLRYWLSEAEAGNDLRGAFFVHNELMGLYRKLGRREEAYREADTALRMTDSEEIGADSLGAATCYLNAATVRKAFGEAEKAVPLYERAEKIYEERLAADDTRLAGLYNNLALALTDLLRFDEAVFYDRKAITLMEKAENGQGDAAISYLNLCDTLMARDGSYVNEDGEPCGEDDPDAYLLVPEETEKEIETNLDRAEALLRDPELRHDGYFAYAAEKCAEVFDYYGRFEMASRLRKLSEKIYGTEAEEKS